MSRIVPEEHLDLIQWARARETEIDTVIARLSGQDPAGIAQGPRFEADRFYEYLMNQYVTLTPVLNGVIDTKSDLLKEQMDEFVYDVTAAYVRNCVMHWCSQVFNSDELFGFARTYLKFKKYDLRYRVQGLHRAANRITEEQHEGIKSFEREMILLVWLATKPQHLSNDNLKTVMKKSFSLWMNFRDDSYIHNGWGNTLAIIMFASNTICRCIESNALTADIGKRVQSILEGTATALYDDLAFTIALTRDWQNLELKKDENGNLGIPECSSTLRAYRDTISLDSTRAMKEQAWREDIPFYKTNFRGRCPAPWRPLTCIVANNIYKNTPLDHKGLTKHMTSIKPNFDVPHKT